MKIIKIILVTLVTIHAIVMTRYGTVLQKTIDDLMFDTQDLAVGIQASHTIVDCMVYEYCTYEQLEQLMTYLVYLQPLSYKYVN